MDSPTALEQIEVIYEDIKSAISSALEEDRPAKILNLLSAALQKMEDARGELRKIKREG